MQSQIVLIRMFRSIACCCIAGFVVWSAGLRAEIWTDNTGKFKIDAEFVKVQGDKVVLKKKSDASTIEVPLRRLNQESQDLAKRLSSRPAPQPTLTPAASTSSNQTPDVYLKELAAAGEAGDYKKLWNALPATYQKDIHDLIHSFATNMDVQLWNNSTNLLKKVVRLLKDKRQFILGHPQVTPFREQLTKAMPPLTEVLDAVVNSELTDLEKLKTFDMQKFAAADGKKIAEKMLAASEAAKELQKLAPVPAALPGAAAAGANPFADLAEAKTSDMKFILVKQEGDVATMKISVKGKESPEEEWIKVEGKWMPKKVADEWSSKIGEAKQWVNTQMKPQLEGVKAQVGFFLAPVNLTLDQLLAAQTQEQFNQVITNLQQQFGGGAPPPM